jgi:hypothetical protein
MNNSPAVNRAEEYRHLKAELGSTGLTALVLAGFFCFG